VLYLIVEVQPLVIDQQKSEKMANFEGKNCTVISEVRTVMLANKEHRAKIIMVDFRESGRSAENRRDNLVVYIHGMGNSSQRFNEAADKADFSGTANTLEYQAIKEAGKNKGVYFECQLLEFPVVEKSPTFREDAKVNLAFLEQARLYPEKSNVIINGYSEGAGVAKHLARLVESLQTGGPENYDDSLRLFSLTGIVPVEKVQSSFSEHIWNEVIMAEAARRINKVYPDKNILEKEIKTSNDQVKVIRMILEEIAIGGKRPEAITQLKEAFRGNMDILFDVGRRIARDVFNSSRQMEKFKADEAVNLDSRWKVEVRIPYHDNIFPIRAWLDGMGIEVDEDFDLMDKTMILKQIMIGRVFPGISQLTIDIFGGPWYMPENYHTGPTDEPSLFYYGKGSNSVSYVGDR